MSERTLCPICEAGTPEIFLRRSAVPVKQNNLYRTPDEALHCIRGDLHMSFCENCGFVFNQAFDPNLMQYSESYNNTQEASGHFVAHIEKMKNRLITAGVRNARIVEAGCGKGYFLKSLIADTSLNNTGIGFDPTYEGDEALFDGRLRFRKEYFDHRCVDIEPDTLVCRHVIEHVDRPLEFLREIKMALRHSPHCRLFFETPCIDWIFATRTIWDFFYEHCSIFSAQSIKFLFEKIGFSVTALDSVFSDQYLWLEAKNQAQPQPASPQPHKTAALLQQFVEAEQQQIQQWLKLLQHYRQVGPVAVWGAGAKGVTFVNLLDPQKELVDCLVDVNPDKHERFVPGTAHPVRTPAYLDGRGFAAIIVMNPNYRDEIASLLQQHGCEAELITEPGESA
jgi:SAM-dependent methyltransferase